MLTTNGASTSIWMSTASVPVFAPLQGTTGASVCVVEAGIAGLTCAYLLSQQGKDVVVIDSLGIGAGETGRTTAHFFPPDEWYAGIERSLGTSKARLIADSFSKAVSLVESIIHKEDIRCPLCQDSCRVI